MTTLLVVTWASGRQDRCDAACHNATHQVCTCCCGGRYHGKQEGSLALHAAVLEHQEALLLELGIQETFGAVWIDAYRALPFGSLIRRRRDRPRVYQEPLGLG